MLSSCLLFVPLCFVCVCSHVVLCCVLSCLKCCVCVYCLCCFVVFAVFFFPVVVLSCRVVLRFVCVLCY